MREDSQGLPAALGWTILALVFLDELLLVLASGVAAAARGGWVLATLAVVAVVVVWGMFASPKAPYGGRLTRPAAKVLVVVTACGGLWATDHQAAAIALAAFSAVVNALALLPSVARLTGEASGNAGR